MCIKRGDIYLANPKPADMSEKTGMGEAHRKRGALL